MVHNNRGYGLLVDLQLMYLQLKRLFEVHCVDATIVWLDELEKTGRYHTGPCVAGTQRAAVS